MSWPLRAHNYHVGVGRFYTGICCGVALPARNGECLRGGQLHLSVGCPASFTGVENDMAARYYKVNPYISAPTCRVCNQNTATYQRIDDSKLGTVDYCSYLCDSCKQQEAWGREDFNGQPSTG